MPTDLICESRCLDALTFKFATKFLLIIESERSAAAAVTRTRDGLRKLS